ncbi:unnamed protein product [Parajaminaea phylloscopi]
MSMARGGSRIVATGCTSGLGAHALKELVRTAPPTLPPPYHLVLLARDATAEHSLRVRDELQAMMAGLGHEAPSAVELQTADLANLSSCRLASRAIADSLKRPPASPSSWSDIAQGRVDVLLLNAAAAKTRRELIQPSESEPGLNEALRDEEGRYEHTAHVNHVAQQLIAAALVPHMISATENVADRVPRIVFTGSALHRRLRSTDDLDSFFDPRSRDGDGRPEGLRWDLTRSYGASKFLQLLGVQQMIRLLQKRMRGSAGAKIEVVVVQPGFVPNTGLNREAPWLRRLFMQNVFPWLPFPFITTVHEGATNIVDACVQPLSSFLISADGNAPQQHGGSTETERQDARHGDVTWLDADCNAIDGVRKALIARKGLREAPDGRTEDATLVERWWPSVVADEWRRSSSIDA